MLRLDLIFIFMAIVGFALFLYGANTYYALAGWMGVYLMVIVFVLKIVFVIWGFVRREETSQKS